MEKSKAREVLGKAKATDKIVCLFTNPYSNKFAAGFVEALSENHVVLRHLTTHGCYDGWRLRALEDLCRIEHGGRYEETLLSLFQARGQNHMNGFLRAVNESTDLISEILLSAQRGDFAVTLSTGADEDVWGFVKTVEATTVTIEKFDTHGQLDGESVIDLEGIEKISVDDDDMQDLKLLARWHDL